MTFARIENDKIVLAEREEVRNSQESGESIYAISTLEAILAVRDRQRLDDALWFYSLVRNGAEHRWVAVQDLAEELAATGEDLVGWTAFYSRYAPYNESTWENIYTIASMKKVAPDIWDSKGIYQATTSRGIHYEEKFHVDTQILLVKLTDEEFAKRTVKFAVYG